MTPDQLQCAAIKTCRLRGENPHDLVDEVVQGEYRGKAPRWKIVAHELAKLEPLLMGIMFAYEQIPPE